MCVDRPAGVDWGPPLPEGGPPLYPILTPRPHRPVTAVVLSKHIEGVHVHFLATPQRARRGRTVPHLTPCTSCPGCCAGLRVQWQGWVAGYDLRPGRLVLVHLTPGVLRSAQGDHLIQQADLRGWCLRLERLGERADARIGLTCGLWRGDTSTLPPAFDVRAALMRLWSGDDRGPP